MKSTKRTPAQAKRRAWHVFSLYIRLRDSLRTTGTKTHLICCTCERTVNSFGACCAQAGHFIPGRHNSVLFDERNIHGQCRECNLTYGGRWPAYYEFMRKRYGDEIIAELVQRDKEIRQFKTYELAEMTQGWLDKIKQMEDGYESDNPTRDA